MPGPGCSLASECTRSVASLFALPCVAACSLLRSEAAPPSHLPLRCLQSNELVPYTVTVQSDLAVCLSLSRRAFMQLMGHGPAVTGLSSEDAATAGATLMGTPQLKGLSDSEIKAGTMADVVSCLQQDHSGCCVWAALMLGLPGSATSALRTLLARGPH